MSWHTTSMLNDTPSGRCPKCRSELVTRRRSKRVIGGMVFREHHCPEHPTKAFISVQMLVTPTMLLEMGISQWLSSGGTQRSLA